MTSAPSRIVHAFASRGLGLLAGVALAAAFVKSLGFADYGQYATASVLATGLTNVTQAGANIEVLTSSIASTDVSDASRLLRRTAGVTVLTVAVLIALSIGADAMHSGSFGSILRWVSALLGWRSIHGFATEYARSRGRIVAASWAAQSVPVALGALALLILPGPTVPAVVFVQVGAGLLLTLVLLDYRVLRGPSARQREHSHVTRSMFGITMAAFALGESDVLIASLALKDTRVGLYSLALRFSLASAAGQLVTTNAFADKIRSDLTSADRDHRRRSYDRYARISLAIALAGAGVALPSFLVVVGNEVSIAVALGVIMPILASRVLAAGSGLGWFSLIAVGRGPLVNRISWISLVAFWASGYAASVRYGIVGLASATSVVFALHAYAFRWYVRNE